MLFYSMPVPPGSVSCSMLLVSSAAMRQTYKPLSTHLFTLVTYFYSSECVYICVNL